MSVAGEQKFYKLYISQKQGVEVQKCHSLKLKLINTEILIITIYYQTFSFLNTCAVKVVRRNYPTAQFKVRYRIILDSHNMLIRHGDRQNFSWSLEKGKLKDEICQYFVTMENFYCIWLISISITRKRHFYSGASTITVWKKYPPNRSEFLLSVLIKKIFDN